MNVACSVVVDKVFDQFRFVNKVGTQLCPQVGEERRTHSVQNASAVIHGEENQSVAASHLLMAEAWESSRLPNQAGVAAARKRPHLSSFLKEEFLTCVRMLWRGVQHQPVP